LRNRADYRVTLESETSTIGWGSGWAPLGISDERAGERRLEAVGYVLRLVRQSGKTLGHARRST
jgi:hypothetical protein